MTRDVRTHWRRIGTGPLLVLVHGAEADHTMFVGLMERLAADFTVVAYDQRDSGATRNGDAPYGLDELAEDLAELVEESIASGVDRRAHLYGTSFGGQIAQVALARHADLFDRVVLGSTWRVGRSPSEFNPDVIRELTRLRSAPQPDAAAIAPYFLTPGHLHAHPEAADMFGGKTRTSAQRQRRAGMIQAAPPVIDLGGVPNPVLLLAGGADRLVPPPVTFELADHLPNTTCRVLDGLPHILAIESPARTADALRAFLQSPGKE